MKSYLLQLLAAFLVISLSSACTNQGDEQIWAESLNNGMNLIRSEKFTEAEVALTKSLEEAEKFGPEDKRVATCLVNLALCYAKKGDYDKAVKVSRKALKIDEKEIGESHEVAYDLNQLGSYLDLAGKHSEARSFFLQSKAMSTKLIKKVPLVKKKVHKLDLGTTLGHLAQNMLYQNKLDEAKEYTNQMLDILKEIDTPRYYFEEFNLVINKLSDRKENAAIESLFEREQKALESKFGAESQWVSILNSRHGKYYIDQLDYVKGEEFYRKILAFRKEKKKEKILIAEAANALAVCLSKQGKYKEALPYFTEVMTLMDGASKEQLASVKANFDECKAKIEGKN